MCVSPECVVVYVLHSHWFGNRLDTLGDRKHWSRGTHHGTALSTLTELCMCPDRATVEEAEKDEVCSCVCAATRTQLCGLVSGDGRVVRYKVSSAQFGCGSEHNETDWGVFVCGRMHLSTLRMYTYSMCARAEWVCLLEMHNNIFGLPVFHGDKGWLLKLQSNGSERCPKACEHTGTQLCTHTPSADSTDRSLCRYGLPDELSIVCNFFALCSVCQGEGEANCLQRNVCL